MRDRNVVGKIAGYFMWVAALGLAAACGERSYGPRLTYERPAGLSDAHQLRTLRDSVAQGDSRARAVPAFIEALEKLEVDFEDQDQAERIERKLVAAGTDTFMAVKVRLSNLEKGPDRDLEVDLLTLFTDVAGANAFARCIMHLKTEDAEIHGLMSSVNTMLKEQGEDRISSDDLRKGVAIESWYESNEDKKEGKVKTKIRR